MERTRNSLQLEWAHTTWRGVDAPCSHLLLHSLPAFVSSRCHCAVHPPLSLPIPWSSSLPCKNPKIPFPSHPIRSLPPSGESRQAGPVWERGRGWLGVVSFALGPIVGSQRSSCSKAGRNEHGSTNGTAKMASTAKRTSWNRAGTIRRNGRKHAGTAARNPSRTVGGTCWENHRKKSSEAMARTWWRE